MPVRSTNLVTRKLATLADALVKCRIARKKYDTSVHSIIAKFFALYSFGQFAPVEIFSWGMLNPRLSTKDLDQFISKERLLEFQGTLNPHSATLLTEDKRKFYLRCAELGLPVPRLFAVVEDGVGMSGTGRVLRTPADWQEELFCDQFGSFVMKPAHGVYGRDIAVLTYDGTCLRGSNGVLYTPDSFHEFLQSSTVYRDSVIQARIENHPSLCKLSGTSALQTVRVVTFMDAANTPRILFATLKIISGENVFDNFAFGRSGNLLGNVDISTGEINSVVDVDDDGIGLVAVSHHPSTGEPFENFQLPDWGAACSLVKEAATAFLPLITIGWDVALTSDGPMLIEGNNTWDPLQNAHRLLKLFKAAFEERMARQSSWKTTRRTGIVRISG